MQEKVTFKRKLSPKGGSLCLTIPPELVEWLGGKPGTPIEMYGDVGKHGKYVAFWIAPAQEE